MVNEWTDFGWCALGMLGGAVAGFVLTNTSSRRPIRACLGRRKRTRSPRATRRGERHPPKLNNDGGRLKGGRFPDGPYGREVPGLLAY